MHKMLFNRKFDGPDDEYFGSPFIAAAEASAGPGIP